ncbi:hypothetical protein [Achromobacter sp. AGC39]
MKKAGAPGEGEEFEMIERILTLDEFVGRSFLLSGVDFQRSGVAGDAQECAFVLDGQTYVAQEDPDDGYRSMLRDIRLDPECPVPNRFEPVRVRCVRDQSPSEDIIHFINRETRREILTLGTSRSDNYYPSFVARFTPENLPHNAPKDRILEPSEYPAEWGTW